MITANWTNAICERAMFQMCGGFAEFEKSIIVEHTSMPVSQGQSGGIWRGKRKRRERIHEDQN
jgi:DNA invertase Pin-like site-specific DNA recombinase